MAEPSTIEEILVDAVLADVAIHATLTEIRRLLAEAYKHYFEKSDGHCKSSEGAIAVHYPPFFWDEDNGYPREPAVEVYSYVLGPSRNHWFDTASEALAAVREWHAAEMACEYDGGVS